MLDCWESPAPNFRTRLLARVFSHATRTIADRRQPYIIRPPASPADFDVACYHVFLISYSDLVFFTGLLSMNLLALLLPLIPLPFYPQPRQPVQLITDTFMDGSLFPESHLYDSAWTTSPLVTRPDVAFVDLSNDALGVHRIDRRRSPFEVVPAPKSSAGALHKAWQAYFPRGSINPKGEIPGGLGFYLSGPKRFRERLPDAKEVIFGYSVMFENDWEWVKGGKLPGICMCRLFNSPVVL